MSRYLTSSIVAVLLLLSVPPSRACEISCPDGSHCSSSFGDCHCDDAASLSLQKITAGQAHCIDIKSRVTADTVDYLLSSKLPRIKQLAGLAEKVLIAEESNDLSQYRDAVREYEKALSRLTGLEREIAISSIKEQ